MISEVGKQIFSGKFNLTSISFPIKAMAPYTILQCVANPGKMNAHFFQLAAKEKDPV
jgi:hypothetical protein